MIKWDDLIKNIRLLKYSVETLEDKEHFLFMMIYFVYTMSCHT